MFLYVKDVDVQPPQAKPFPKLNPYQLSFRSLDTKVLTSKNFLHFVSMWDIWTDVHGNTHRQTSLGQHKNSF